MGLLDEAFDHTARAMSLHVANGEPWGVGDGHFQHARTLAAMGRIEEALRLLDVALAAFREIEEVDNLSRVQLKRGEMMLRLGQVAGAEPALEEATRLANLIGNPTRRLVAAGLQAWRRSAEGDIAGARRIAHGAYARHATLPGPSAKATFLESAAHAWDAETADRLRSLADRLKAAGVDGESSVAAEATALFGGDA